MQINYNDTSFIVTEYIYIGLEKQEKHYPLEKTIINFKENGKHDIVKEFLFTPPKFNNEIIGNQSNKFKIYEDDLTNVYNSRTFCLFEDIELIKKKGLAKGGSLDNAIVVKGEKILNKEVGSCADKSLIQPKNG